MSEPHHQQDSSNSGQNYGSYGTSHVQPQGQPYSPNYSQSYNHQAVQSPEGQKHSQNAMIFGILGIVIAFLGVVFGPLALSQARKAESYGVDATVGKVTGWAGLVLGIIALLFTISYIAFIVILISHAGSTAGY